MKTPVDLLFPRSHLLLLFFAKRLITNAIRLFTNTDKKKEEEGRRRRRAVT